MRRVNFVHSQIREKKSRFFTTYAGTEKKGTPIFHPEKKHKRNEKLAIRDNWKSLIFLLKYHLQPAEDKDVLCPISLRLLHSYEMETRDETYKIVTRIIHHPVPEIRSIITVYIYGGVKGKRDDVCRGKKKKHVGRLHAVYTRSSSFASLINVEVVAMSVSSISYKRAYNRYSGTAGKIDCRIYGLKCILVLYCLGLYRIRRDFVFWSRQRQSQRCISYSYLNYRLLFSVVVFLFFFVFCDVRFIYCFFPVHVGEIDASRKNLWIFTKFPSYKRKKNWRQSKALWKF